MLQIERRIAALENSASDKALKVVVVLDGETQADALKRVGLLEDRRVLFVTPLDELPYFRQLTVGKPATS